ncbi:hypothetical protein HS125_12600 [bacterium]|nr:hypothetical protein [bacterium]
MLALEGRSPARELHLGTAQDALRALAVGWADLAAVPRDPDFRWGLPFDLSSHFVIYRVSDPQPPPLWVLATEWGRACPLGKAALREFLPQYFGVQDLAPVAVLGRAALVSPP